jgi:EAL domain-containing protein (putative c-di-GMP-specific phosphodiesterase class I)
VLLERISGTDEVMRVAGRLQENLRRSFTVDGYRISSVSVSIGIAMKGPTESKTSEQLLQEADAAMYWAKRKDKDRCEVFEPSMTPRILRGKARLEDDLRRAIEGAEFVIHYQPKVSGETGQIVEMEALVRWEHPEGRMITPAGFIPLAEDVSLIVPLGRWVLKEACRQAKEWQEQYPDESALTMNVNFSTRQIHHPALAEEVAAVLEETGLHPSCLYMEITESTAMEDAPSTVAVLRELKELGVEIAIDDFGAGYSSLSYLKRFPVDAIKIDRSIIAGLEQDPGNAAIASAAITLAHALGLEAVAEGVEPEAEAAELRA